MAMLRPLLLLLCLAAGPACAVADAAAWPREVRAGDATVVLYEPQFDALDGVDARARMAVAIRRPGAAPEFGALWVATTLDIDQADGTASFATFMIERARFPGATEQEVRELTALLERTAPAWDLRLSLAELRVAIAAGTANSGFNNDPPRIIYRDHPAILVTIDGTPALQKVPDTSGTEPGKVPDTFQRVSNASMPIVHDGTSGQYWLPVGPVWFTTADLLRGAWEARDPPAAIVSLVSTTVPAEAGASIHPEVLREAEIIVATIPTALISTEGAPQYRPLVRDELLYVTNTGSDLFLEVPTRLHYIVLSGRWFRSPSLAGPWSYVAPEAVPPAFAEVPRNSGKAGVLAHVPGTEEATDAVMDAMIPETAAVRRGMARLDVTYDGSPHFEPIPGTSLLYASNTASQVLKVGDRYYAVDEGVWYVGDSAWGPWAIAEARPGEVAAIPPSSPAYNLRYVYIYDFTPEVVHTGYLPGYRWSFPYRGAIVYGTGHGYRPWHGPTYYYGRPVTWGFQRYYDPWYGWGHGFGWRPGWTPYYWGWGALGPVGHRPPAPRGPRRDVRPPPRTQIGTLPGIGGRPSARFPVTAPPPVSGTFKRPPVSGTFKPLPPVESRRQVPAKPPRATISAPRYPSKRPPVSGTFAPSPRETPPVSGTFKSARPPASGIESRPRSHGHDGRKSR